MRWATTREYEFMYKNAEVAKQQLEQVGFNVDLQVLDWATLNSRALKPELWDVASTGLVFTADPANHIVFRCNWWGNWCHEEKEQLLAELARESDVKKRKALVERMQAIFYEDVGRVKLGDYFTLDVARRELRGPFRTAARMYFWNSWLAEMTRRRWRARAGTPFQTEKRPSHAARGMVVTNHPLASAAGAEMLAAGGNAVDAAVAALFALTVVEPMMVGIFGAGHAQLRLAGGRHTVIDSYTTAPAAARPDMYRPLSDTWPDDMEAVGRENSVGPRGRRAGHARGLVRDARRASARSTRDGDGAGHPPRRARLPRHRLPRRVPRRGRARPRPLPGQRARVPARRRAAAPRRAARAGRLRATRCARSPPRVRPLLYGGALGRRVAEHMAREGGLITLDDLPRYRTIERAPVRGTYRGFDVVGCPPPTGGGIHLSRSSTCWRASTSPALGFGTVDGIHLLAEALKIAFADRAAATGDPAFVDVPVARLIAKDYAAARRAEIDMAKAGAPAAGVAAGSPHTTHVTVADGDGNVVAATQTINGLFGSRAMVPGTGMLLNNTMALFDPHPGPRAVDRARQADDQLDGADDPAARRAAGPGPGPARRHAHLRLRAAGHRERRRPRHVAAGGGRGAARVDAGPGAGGRGRGRRRRARGAGRARPPRGRRPHVAGGMGAIAFEADGTLTGASCWRADGTPVGLGGGYARAGIRFWPDRRTPPSPRSPSRVPFTQHTRRIRWTATPRSC